LYYKPAFPQEPAGTSPEKESVMPAVATNGKGGSHARTAGNGAANVPVAMMGQLVAKDQVVEFIRNRILAGHYKAGQYLSESILQRHMLESNLDFSRVPIREALVSLRAEKLVEIVPKRGTFISRTTPAEVKEILRARLVIEQYVARELALNPDLSLREAEEINREIKSIAKEDGSSEVRLAFTRLDGEFHNALSNIAGFGSTFSEQLQMMRNRIRLFLFPRDRSLHARMAAKAALEHQTILRAIRPHKRPRSQEELAANARRAERAVCSHLRNALQRWELPVEDKTRIRLDLPDIFGTA
jgi:DNA-binding GntR family transcriptional regulator